MLVINTDLVTINKNEDLDTYILYLKDICTEKLYYDTIVFHKGCNTGVSNVFWDLIIWDDEHI